MFPLSLYVLIEALSRLTVERRRLTQLKSESKAGRGFLDQSNLQQVVRHTHSILQTAIRGRTSVISSGELCCHA